VGRLTAKNGGCRPGQIGLDVEETMPDGSYVVDFLVSVRAGLGRVAAFRLVGRDAACCPYSRSAWK
jgi:hypothetical protein